MRRTTRIAICGFGALALLTCGGEPFDDPHPTPPPADDRNAKQPASSPTPPSATEAAAPKAGELCPAGVCEASSICIGGLCHKKCMQTSRSCNDIARACPSGQTCLGATSFTDACFSSSATTGELCGDAGHGALCRSGNLCVAIEGAPARCLKLCKYNCPPGRCVQTDNGCGVCLP